MPEKNNAEPDLPVILIVEVKLLGDKEGEPKDWKVGVSYPNDIILTIEMLGEAVKIMAVEARKTLSELTGEATAPWGPG